VKALAATAARIASRVNPRFSPAARTAIALALLTCLFVTAAIRPVFLALPPVDEVTWADRSLSPWWFPYPREGPDGPNADSEYGKHYYYAIHHPTVTRIIYRFALHSAGIRRQPSVTYDYSLTFDENLRRGNVLPYRMRTVLRITNACFVLAALVLLFFALLRIAQTRLLAVAALVPIVYEPTLTGAFNCTVGYIGADAVLMFMLVCFLCAWLAVRDKGIPGAVILGLLAGLATSTKYSGAVVLIAAMIFYAFRERGWRRAVLPFVAGSLASIVFLALNPVYFGGGLEWAVNVFRDTISIHSRLQGKATLDAFYVSDRWELLRAYLPHVSFALPLIYALREVRRAPWFGPTALWGLSIIVGHLVVLRVFLPTYAGVVRLALLVLVMSAGLARIAQWRARRRGEGQVPEPGHRERSTEGGVANGEDKVSPPAGRMKLRMSVVAVLLAAVAAAGMLMPSASSFALVLIPAAVVFMGARLISGGSAAAVIVTASLFATLWPPASTAQPMILFTSGALIMWALWLHLSRRGAQSGAGPVALASGAAFALSPHSLAFLLMVAAAWVLVGPRAGRRRLLSALLLPPVAIVCSQFLAMKVLGLPPAPFPRWNDLTWTLSELWNVMVRDPGLFSAPYHRAVLDFGKGFQWPLVIVAALFVIQLRRSRWFAATFAGGALLTVGALTYGQSPYFQHSVPMQVGLLLPLSIAAVEAWRSRDRVFQCGAETETRPDLAKG
jgi:hypothetical protein